MPELTETSEARILSELRNFPHLELTATRVLHRFPSGAFRLTALRVQGTLDAS
jgi:hypothetical protein